MGLPIGPNTIIRNTPIIMETTLTKDQRTIMPAIHESLAIQVRDSFSSGITANTINWDGLPESKFIATFNKRLPLYRQEGSFDIIQTPLASGWEIVSTSN
jgi:hypothetical protein